MCLQGLQLDVAKALSHLQLSPLATLYQYSKADASGSCAAKGFPKLYSDKDDCFPRLSLWYAPSTIPGPGAPQNDLGNLYQLQTIVTGVLLTRDFLSKQANGTAAEAVCQRNLTSGEAFPTAFLGKQLLETQDNKSSSGSGSGNGSGSGSSGAVKVGSHVPDSGLLCNEAPLHGGRPGGGAESNFTIFTMVDLLKTGSLGSLQQLDGARAVSCAERGFGVALGGPAKADHCYGAQGNPSSSVLWYRGDAFSLYKQEWLEAGALLEWDSFHGAPTGSGLQKAECDCWPDSEVRKALPAASCRNSTATAVV